MKKILVIFGLFSFSVFANYLPPNGDVVYWKKSDCERIEQETCYFRDPKQAEVMSFKNGKWVVDGKKVAEKAKFERDREDQINQCRSLKAAAKNLDDDSEELKRITRQYLKRCM